MLRKQQPLRIQVASAVCDSADLPRHRFVAESTLAVEGHQLEWPATIAKDIDFDLASLYPVFDLDSALLIKHATKYHGISAPKFALYDVDKPGVCHLACGPTDFGMIMWFTATPQATPEKTSDVWPTKAKEFYTRQRPKGDRHAVSLTAKFSGIIPAEAKQQIQKAKTQFDSVLLLQEAVEWDAELHPVPDPLIIGVKNGVYYLVGDFDTTTMEEYVKKEFTA